MRPGRRLRVRLMTVAAALLITALAVHTATVGPTAEAIPAPPSEAAASQLPAEPAPSDTPAPCDAACPQDCGAGIPGCDAQLAPTTPDSPRDVPAVAPPAGLPFAPARVPATRSRPVPALSPLELSVSRT
jgi:hypothetical protein